MFIVYTDNIMYVKQIRWLLCNTCNGYYKYGNACQQCMCIKCYYKDKKKCNLKCTIDETDLSIIRIPVLIRSDGDRTGCYLCSNYMYYTGNLIKCICRSRFEESPQLSPLIMTLIYLQWYLLNYGTDTSPVIKFLKRLKSTPDNFVRFNSLLADKQYFNEQCILTLEYYKVLSKYFHHDIIGIIIRVLLQLPDDFVFSLLLVGQEFLWLN